MATVLAVALVSLTLVTVAAKEVANQVNDPPPTDAYDCGATGRSLFQSFAPASADVTSVVLRLEVRDAFPDAGLRMTVALRSGSPSGSRLASSSVTVTGPREPGASMKVRFAFTPQVRVTPGLRYVLELMSPAAEGTDAAALVGWFGTSDNPYARGTAFGCDAQPISDRDYNFVAYSSAPAQATITPLPTWTTVPSPSATTATTPTATITATTAVTPTSTIIPTGTVSATLETPAATATTSPTVTNTEVPTPAPTGTTVPPTVAPSPTDTAAPTDTVVPPTHTVAPSKTVTPTVGTPVPTQELSTVCPQIVGRVPRAAIDSAVANPNTIAGYNQLWRPNQPESPYNRRRVWLSMDAISRPYHPLFNGLVYKVGCP